MISIYQLVVAALLLSVAGCAGGRWHIIDLNFRRLPDDAKLIEPVGIDECYWWTENDSVCIAMRRARIGVISKLHRERTSLSLVLPGLPANQARDYQLDSRSIRAYLRHGTRHERFGSTRGIASIRHEPFQELSGRFRLTARRQIFNILTGWSNAGSVVITGRFQARHDADKGQAILRLTEEEGMNRGDSKNVGTGTYGVPRQVTGPPVGEKESRKGDEKDE